MSIAGFRRQFTQPWVVSPYYNDYTDPDDFIVYAGDVGAVMLYDDVTGFTADGTYTIRYDFTGGAVVDSDNAGMWNEYTYERSGGGTTRIVHSRQKVSPYQAATSWVLESTTGTVPTEIFLSAAMSVSVYVSDLADNIGSEAAEDKFPGTWTIKRTITGPVNNSSDVEICSFELRTLAVRNLRADKPIFDPCSETPYTLFKADILALPPGWEPDELGIFLGVSDPVSDGNTNPLQDSFSWEVSSPDSNGKIAEVEIPWDGRNTFFPHYSDGTYPLDDEPYEGLFLARMYAAKDLFLQSFEKKTNARSVRCACRCPGNRISGAAYFVVPLADLVTTPFGPAIDLKMSYCTGCSQQEPSSMGYGWRSNGSVRVFEDGDNGALSYRNESGNYLRWKLDGSDYVRTTSDNLLSVAKTEDPDATYIIRFPDQSTREFDEDGRLMRDVDRNGNALTYTYDSGHLSTMTDAAGNVVTFDYTGRVDGQPVSISSGGRTTELAYNLDGRLETVTNPEGETTGFVYNAEGLLWKILDARDEEAVVYEYDEHERIVSETTYGLKKVETFYGEDAKSMYPESGVVEYNYLATVETDLTDETAPQRIVAYNLNHLGQVAAQAESGEGFWNITVFEYTDENHSHLVTKVIKPNLSVTEMEYNERGDITKVTDNNGNETVYLYTEDVDSSPFNPLWAGLVRKILAPAVTVGGVLTDGPVTEFQYDSLGNLIKVIDALENETEFEVRPDGLIESITDRRGQTTTFTYRSSDNRLETITSPAGPNSAPARTVTFDYDSFGNLTSVLDPLGREVTREYDGNDRLVKVTDALGQYVDFNYTDGRMTSIGAPSNAGSSSNRRTSQMVYDDANRLIRVNGEVASSTFEKRVGYRYDGFSQLKALERLQGGLDKETAYAYDPLGRLTSAQDFLARETTVSHAPFCTENTVTSPGGIRTRTSYDSLCQLTEIERSVSGGDALAEAAQFSYDELGRLTEALKGSRFKYEDETVDPSVYKGGKLDQSEASSKTTFTYDLLGRILTSNRDGEVTAYEYDEEGNVTLVTHPNGRSTAYSYYNDGRLYTVSYSDSESGTQTFTYSYDLAGQLETIEYPSSTGLVASFTKPNDDPGWDDNGQLLCLRYLRLSIT